MRARIYIIDDEELITETLTEILQLHHDVFPFVNSEKAFAALQAEKNVDLIFCDVLMPSISGIELYERLKKENPSLGDKFVFMTGDAFIPKTAEFLEKVSNPKLEKPFRFTDITTLIDKCMEAKEKANTSQADMAPLANSQET